MPRGGGRKGAGRPPGSRNKVSREIAAAAREYGVEALDFLVTTVRDASEVTSERIKAAKEILDRGYGKAPQAHKVSGAISSFDMSRLAHLPDEQINLVYDVLRLAAPDSMGDSD